MVTRLVSGVAPVVEAAPVVAVETITTHGESNRSERRNTRFLRIHGYEAVSNNGGSWGESVDAVVAATAFEAAVMVTVTFVV